MSKKKKFTLRKYLIISTFLIMLLAVVLSFLVFIDDLPEETTISLISGSCFCLLACFGNAIICSYLDGWLKKNNYETPEESCPQTNECPNCFHPIEPTDTECKYCGYILKPKE